jgi:serine/threonine protein kinase
MPAPEVRKLGAELADALAFLHAQDIVHRDLKPANVLLAPDRPMISDFGTAHQPDFTTLTGTGDLIGTPAYMAPEQVRGETVGAAADVYSLGLILLECLTGHCEYPGPPAESAVARLHRAPVLPADIDPQVSALLSRMTTAPCPADRPTAREVAEVLSRRRPLSPPGPQHRHTRQRAAARVLATAGFFTAAAAVTAGLILGSRTAVDPDTSPPAGAGTETVVPPPATPLSPGEVTETVVAGNHDETAAAARHPVATTSSPFVRQPEDATSSALQQPAVDGATASDKSKKDHPGKTEKPPKTTRR